MPGSSAISLKVLSEDPGAVVGEIAQIKAPTCVMIWRLNSWKPSVGAKRKSQSAVRSAVPPARAQVQPRVRKPSLAPPAVAKVRLPSVVASSPSPRPAQSAVELGNRSRIHANRAMGRDGSRKMHGSNSRSPQESTPVRDFAPWDRERPVQGAARPGISMWSSPCNLTPSLNGRNMTSFAMSPSPFPNSPWAPRSAFPASTVK